MQTVRNTAELDVEITDVSLVNPRNLKLVEAVLVPIEVTGEATLLIGLADGYPPTDPPTTWDEHVPAAGAKVPPKPKVPLSLALGLETVGPAGSADGALVRYTGPDGREYEERGHIRIRVRRTC